MYKQSYEFAKLKLDRKVAARTDKSRPLAVVLDIDETVLDNSPYEVKGIRDNFLYAHESWVDWTSRAQAAALPGALDFIQHAQKQGVDVFLISNRKTEELEPTLRNLKQVGFEGFSDKNVLLKTNSSDKTPRRSQVAATHEIALLVGDNLTDFKELYRDRSQNYGLDLVESNWADLNENFIMLPNPMYGDWQGILLGNKKLSPAQQDSCIKAQLKGY